MIVTYARTGGETSKWDYKPDDILSAEAEAVEGYTGMTFDEVNIALLKGGVKARRAVLWLLMKREDPSLKYAAVQFKNGEVTVGFDAQEKADTRAAIQASTGISEDERELLLASLEDDDEEPAEGVVVPKAEPSSDAST